ncbi:MAG: hypothetical protein R3D58_13260 [Saprospiraceae bacterium]
MAKCGHDICPDDSCGWKHPFNKSRRNNCRRVQACFEETCSSLKVLGGSGFVLYDACLGHCHRKPNDPKAPGRYPTPEQYLCANFDPVTLVDYFSVDICDLPDGKQTQQQKRQQEEDESRAQTRNALIFIGLIVLILLVFVWNKKG